MLVVIIVAEICYEQNSFQLRQGVQEWGRALSDQLRGVRAKDRDPFHSLARQ